VDGAFGEPRCLWRRRVGRDQTKGDVIPPLVDAPAKVVKDPASTATATPAPAPAPAKELPSNGFKGLVNEVNKARDVIDKAEQTVKSKLLDANGSMIGGAGFKDFAKSVEKGDPVTKDDATAFLVSIEEHGKRLSQLSPAARITLPESLSSLDKVSATLNEYWPLLRGDEDALFPRGFSAAPIAYYVSRSEDNIQRDACEELRLNYATNRVQPSKSVRSRCSKYWSADTAPEAEEAFCNARRMLNVTKMISKPLWLRHKCRKHWEAADKKWAAEQKHVELKPPVPKAAELKASVP
jgi:hypothetical protein